jgi:hypothetical protein
MKTLARPRDQAGILDRLRALRPDCARRWGRMSAHQMVVHLADSYRVATGERPVRARGSFLGRTLVKWFALYLPLRWPPGVRTTSEVDAERGGSRPTDFAADLAQLEALLEAFTAEARRLDGRAHPVFGRMSEAAWLRWGYLHADHHLRQFGA